MAHENTVIRSINLGGDMGGETICVDLFRRPDGSFGFDEFHRDPEDGRGRHGIGHHGAARFAGAEAAMAAAKAAVGRLADAAGPVLASASTAIVIFRPMNEVLRNEISSRDSEHQRSFRGRSPQCLRR